MARIEGRNQDWFAAFVLGWLYSRPLLQRAARETRRVGSAGSLSIYSRALWGRSAIG